MAANVIGKTNNFDGNGAMTSIKFTSTTESIMLVIIALLLILMILALKTASCAPMHRVDWGIKVLLVIENVAF